MKKPRNYRKVRSSGLWAREGVGNFVTGRSRKDIAVIAKRGLLDRGGQSEVLHHSRGATHDVHIATTMSAEAVSIPRKPEQAGEPLSNTDK